ncbi:MAG: glycosyltransferase family 2 protein [Bacteroidota bacterium]|nr:glycosyltransferase family 2 protein [Candidatus Kapabacteria bacterium]MDW8220692.1 glycosyltransferase family 2 protein [Bacteroidota bacterium]
MSIFLSIVIPAYNEQHRIADTLYAVKHYLAQQEYSSEVIIVDDGSTDYTTEVVRTVDIYSSEIHNHKVSIIMENVKNVGKGFSVARGMLKAQGEIILFSDADLATPIQEVEKFLPYFAQGYDIVIGSRRLPDSDVEKKPFYRDIMSILFNTLVQAIAVHGIHDTQCGFKAFRRAVAHDIARLQRTYRFGFDVEQLYIASKRGYRIKEVPVRWVHQAGSTVRPMRDAFGMIADVIRIKYMHASLQPPTHTPQQ